MNDFYLIVYIVSGLLNLFFIGKYYEDIDEEKEEGFKIFFIACVFVPVFSTVVCVLCIYNRLTGREQ